MSVTPTQWFIEPQNPATNERLAALLAADGQSVESEMVSLEVLTVQKCAVRVRAWRVLHDMVTRFAVAKRTDATLKFRVFTRAGARGTAKQWIFEEKPKKAKKVKQVEKDLERLKDKKRT